MIIRASESFWRWKRRFPPRSPVSFERAEKLFVSRARALMIWSL
jgi:hypothetical protein